MSPKGTEIPMATLIPVVRPELGTEVLLKNDAVVLVEGDKGNDENDEADETVVGKENPVAIGLPDIVTGRITP
jgi:hypothetical protein